MEMTAQEFRRELARMGLNQSSLAREFGISRETVSRWARDLIPVPGPVVAYLRLLDVSRCRGDPLKGWREPETFDEWPDHAQVVIKLTAGEVRKIQGKR